MGVGGIAAAVSAAVGVASVAYQMSQRPPNLNQGNATAEGVRAQSEMLPLQRMYEQAANTGGWAVRYGYDMVQATPAQRARMQQQLSAIDQQIAAARNNQQGGGIPSLNTISQLQDQRTRLANQIAALPATGGTVFVNHQTGQVAPRDQAVVDFSGMGRAQVQGRLAAEMAQVQLGLQQKYGTQFADEARQEIEQSDPQGTQARARLNELIQEQNNAHPERPVAELLDKQVGDQLSSGNRLDPAMRSVLDDEVARAEAARGQGGTSSQTFADPMETGYEGQQRQLAGIQKANSWLSSGATPEDVEYRRQQQNFANLGAFVNGQTPEAQFRNLSAGQQGTTPFQPGQALPLGQNGAGNSGANYATAGYLQNLRYQQSQINPWMAGLTGLLGAGRAAGGAGWQPFSGGGAGSNSSSGGLG